jgi:UDP-2,4-diacetamido-2,4,6-trideoxy-beta-L-altropyranose hydrolase
MHTSNKKKFKRRIIFRADGNSQIGLGHVIRSLALADLLRQDFLCAFIIREPSIELKAQILAICEQIVELDTDTDPQDEVDVLCQKYIRSDDIVVLDGYHFKTDYQQIIKSKGNSLVCIDDIHAYHFMADVVINHSGGIQSSQYSVEPYTRLCLGPAYALLREPFLKAAQEYKSEINTRAVFINLGGADANNYTLLVLQQALLIPDLEEIHVVIGSAYLYKDALAEFNRKEPRFIIYFNLTANEICDLMKMCGVAICAPSSVAYEYCTAKGLLFLQQTAGNQAHMLNFLISEGLAYPVEALPEVLLSSERHQHLLQMASNQQKYLSGGLAERIQRIFKDIEITSTIHWRVAEPGDMMLIFEWTNDPEVRKHSFNKAPIALDTHQAWFYSKLKERTSLFLIAEIENKPAAQIRFDVKNDHAVISYSVGNNFRGKGLGHLVLTEGIKQLLLFQPDVRQIVGYVKKNNVPSLRSFEKASFSMYDSEEISYPDSVVFRKFIPQ